MSPRREDDQRAAPSIESVRALCGEILAITTGNLAVYWQSYKVAYARTVSGAEGKTAIWESDPTKNVALSKEKRRLRQELREAAEEMKDALSTLKAAQTKMTKAMERAHGTFTYAEAVRMARGERDGDFPRTMKDAEIAELKKAQRKREERGEAS